MADLPTKVGESTGSQMNTGDTTHNAWQVRIVCIISEEYHIYRPSRPGGECPRQPLGILLDLAHYKIQQSHFGLSMKFLFFNYGSVVAAVPMVRVAVITGVPDLL